MGGRALKIDEEHHDRCSFPTTATEHCQRRVDLTEGLSDPKFPSHHWANLDFGAEALESFVARGAQLKLGKGGPHADGE